MKHEISKVNPVWLNATQYQHSKHAITPRTWSSDKAYPTLQWWAGMIMCFGWALSLVPLALIGSWLLFFAWTSVWFPSCIFLDYWIIKKLEQRRLATIPAREREWHQTYVSLYETAANVNARLAALQEWTETAKPEEQPGPDVVAKCRADSERLEAVLAPFHKDIEKRERANKRKATLAKLRDTLAANKDGTYMDTRDVSDAAYVAGLTIAEEEHRTRVAATDDALAQDDSSDELVESEIPTQHRT